MNHLLTQLRYSFIICLTLVRYTSGMHATEFPKPATDANFSTAALIVPGVGGGGQDSFEPIHPAGTQRYEVPPLVRRRCDLGQRKCIQQLDEFVKASRVLENNKILCFGASQGAATILNYLATLSEEQKQKIAAIILEGPVIDGNEAIRHTAANTFPPASYLPFSRIWLPWIAKTQLPAYNPFGKQAIRMSDKIPKNVPVILLHATGDPEVPIDTTRKFYQTLIKNGHQDVYLFEVPVEQHLELLYSDKQQEFLNAILRIYDESDVPLPLRYTYDTTNNNVESYKPSLEEVSNRIQASPETKRKKIQAIIDITCLCPPVGIGYILYHAKHRDIQNH
ncbi:DUF1749 domain-containing protein [Candidatus Dependentiae bacterium]|nr:DUF1749 domain-containing protein [Candidatus Dependentiae bacterium]